MQLMIKDEIFSAYLFESITVPILYTYLILHTEIDCQNGPMCTFNSHLSKKLN